MSAELHRCLVVIESALCEIHIPAIQDALLMRLRSEPELSVVASRWADKDWAAKWLGRKVASYLVDFGTAGL